MKQTDHVTNKIADYALGLVTEYENREIARHLAGCRQCQQALHRERQLSLAVRDAIFQATQPDQQRLHDLRPSFPGKEQPSLIGLNWQPRFAVVGLLLVLVFAALSLHTQLRQEAWIGPSPAIYSTVAIVTDTPTKTLPATRNEPEPADTTSPTPVAHKPLALPHPAIVPVPAATILH